MSLGQVDDALLRAAMENPELVLRELDKACAEERLIDFVRLIWPVIEPAHPFIDGWVINAICEHLEAVSRGEIKRLLINVPPGTSKSTLLNVCFPAWEWGPRNLPSTRYVCASYSEDLTIRDNRKCRAIVESELYRSHWGDRFQLVSDQNAKVRFDTDKTGFKIATSVGGLGVGERGDRFMVDDPHNVREAESDAKRNGALQWFSEVVPTRINDPERSAIIVIMQRLHEQDVSGLILSERLGYDHLCIPMEFEKDHPTPSRTVLGWRDPRTEDGELMWPERFSARHVETELKPQLRAWGGEYAEAGQLRQAPVPRGGGMFKRDNFKFVEAPPEHPVKIARGWDLAGSDKTNKRAAYTTGARISVDRRGSIYLEDMRRDRLTPLGVENLVVQTAETDGYAVDVSLPQDPGQAGKAQVSAFAAKLHGYRVHFSVETGDKEDRAKPFAAQVEAGNVYLVKGPWNEEFLKEATQFPAGTFKDQIDACSRAYARLIGKKPRRVAVGPLVIEVR